MIADPLLDRYRPLPEGTYLFTGRLAERGYRLNRFCFQLRDSERRRVFQADEAGAMTAAGLDADAQALVLARDWLGLLRYGANLFLMLRLTAAVGTGLAATGAQMRGETLEAFLATRNVPEAR